MAEHEVVSSRQCLAAALQVKKRGKTLTSKSNPRSIFYQRKGPSEFETSESDISQMEAKTFLPPGASIWRSNYRGGRPSQPGLV